MNVTRNLDVPGSLKFNPNRRQLPSHNLARLSLGGIDRYPPRGNLKPGNLTVIMSDSETTSENLQSWHDWIGQRVSISGIKCGILRYFGSTEFSTGTWCGVELDEPVGKNNGTVRGVQYFVCEDNYGIFAPLSKTTKIVDRQLPPAKNMVKMKLPSPKIKKQENICDNDTIDFNKTIHYNMNNDDTNPIEDMFKKLRRQSSPAPTNKFGFGQANNNDGACNNKFSNRRSIVDFRTKFSTSAPQPANDNEPDPLNRTITLENKNITFCGQNANLDATISFPTREFPNSEFEIPLSIMNVQDKCDSTFIMNSSNRAAQNNLDEIFRDQFGSHEDLLSFDCDESLGILSPSEMKDFSSSFENTFVGLHSYRSNIPKNMSCDDVKEIPEFEVQNTVLASHSNPVAPYLESITSQFNRNNVLNLDKQSHVMHSSPDEAPRNENMCCNDETKNRQKTLGSESDSILFGLSDGLDYAVFSSSCDKRAFNSSLHAGNFCNDQQNTNRLLDINMQETTLCNPDHTIYAYANEKVVIEPQLSQILERTEICPSPISHLLKGSGDRNSFAALDDETLPTAVLSFSEIDTERRNSLGSSRLPIGEHLISPTSSKDPRSHEPLSTNSGENANEHIIAQNFAVLLENTNALCDIDSPVDTNKERHVQNQLDCVGQEGAAISSTCNVQLSIEKMSGNVTFEKKIQDTNPMIINNSSLTVTKSQLNLDLLTSSPMNQRSDSDCPQSGNHLAGNTLTPSCLNQTTVIQVEKLVDPSKSLENDLLNLTQVIDTSPLGVTQNISVPFINSNQVKTSPEGEVITEICTNNYEAVDSKPLDSTISLNQTYDKATLSKAVNQEKDQAEISEINSVLFDSPSYNQLSLDDSSPLLGGGIEDISCISPNFSAICDVSDDAFNATICIPTQRDTTYGVQSDEKNKNKIPLQGRKSMFPSISMSKVRQSTPIQSNKSNKKSLMPKVNDLDLGMPVSSQNQENMSALKLTTAPKKPGKWDAITSKIAAGLTENKSPKSKKDIVSRVNTNLDGFRHSTPKTSPGTTTKFKKTFADAFSDESKIKTGRKSTTDNKTKQDNVESRVLTQLQNVAPSKQLEFKVPVGLARRKTGLLGKVTSQLPSPTDSADTTKSMPAKLGVNSRKSIVPKNQTAAPSKKQDFAVPAGLPPKIMGRTSIGKAKEPSNKDAKTARWSTGSLPKTPIAKPEPRKFISKTELVREIQELGATCENRTKELNLLKIRLRHATLGFEAFAILNKYMIEEYDPFSQPRLQNEYNKAKDELYEAGEQLQVYRKQLDELQTVHADELMELTEKLGIVHADEISETKSRHADELAEVDTHHKQKLQKLKERYKKEAEENDDANILSIKELHDQYERQKRELTESQSKRLTEIQSSHNSVLLDLQNQLENLNRQYSSLQDQLRQAEAAFMRDKNARIQYMSSKKNELEKEVDSLKAVLDIKTTQIQDLHKENYKIKKQLEELPAAKEKIRKLELKTEDLKATMQLKVKLHRELSSENQQLMIVCEKEAKMNSRLSQTNEELQWRLQQSMENSLRSSSLCASPDLWSREDDQRSSSRMSLPILQSERVRSLTDSPIHASISLSRAEDQSTPRGHSMSMSWHPALPTHVESPLAPEASTPLRAFSARGSRFNPMPQSRLSILKLKKDIESEMLRRNSSIGGQKLPMTRPRTSSSPMSMSWGGENLDDYYDELDDSCLQILAEQQSGQTRKFFIKYDNDRKKGRKSKQLAETLPEQDLEMIADKSLSGLTSLQSSCYSSSDSCSSYLPTQPGSEDSNSPSSSSSAPEKSQDPNPYVSSTVKPPRELAGESMIQETEIMARLLLQESGHLKAGNGNSITDASSSSPEDGKDSNGGNVASVATPSIETSSQGMADSTNLDVSWGDEEMPSENDLL